MVAGGDGSSRQRSRVGGAGGPCIQASRGELTGLGAARATCSSSAPGAAPERCIRQAEPVVQQVRQPFMQQQQARPAGGDSSNMRSSSPALEPQPPAPRCWTPSKLAHGSGGGAAAACAVPRGMTPAEALEQEMQELSCEQPGSPALGAMIARQHQQRPHSCTPSSGFISVSEADAARRPSSSGHNSPHAAHAQHNNLLVGSASGRPHSTGCTPHHDDGWSAQLRLNKLRDVRDRLTGSSDGSSSTAVEAFSPCLAGPVCSSGSSPVVVAQRRGTAPARLAPSSAGTSAGSRSAAEWEQDCSALLAIGDRLGALQLAGPSNGIVRCFIKRTSNLLGVATLYELRVEATDELLAVAHKRLGSAASCHDISLPGMHATAGWSSSGCSTPSSGPSQHGGSTTGGGILAPSSSSGSDQQLLVGKLKANLLGTEYLLRGRGGHMGQHKGFNGQLLAVNYRPTVNHIQAAPRTMTAAIPVPKSRVWDGSQAPSAVDHHHQLDSLTACVEAARERQLPMAYERSLVMLHTMKPHYDEVKQVHYLDFKGRVTEGSLKNFQLVHWDHNSNSLGAELVLLFGKRGAGEYALDFSYPMTPLQAFGLGLSSLDSKLCYVM